MLTRMWKKSVLGDQSGQTTLEWLVLAFVAIAIAIILYHVVRALVQNKSGELEGHFPAM